MHELVFQDKGICRIRLIDIPSPEEIEELIEEYVTRVELLPCELRVILIDISGLRHMTARARQVFSELLVQASAHYQNRVKLVVAGGSRDLRIFIKLFCKGIGMQERSLFFPSVDQAVTWLSTYPS